MDTLKVTIHQIKNIRQAQLELPFDNGLYTLVGTNGCGKSTIMLCLAQLISSQLDRLIHSDACDDSYLQFGISGKINTWKRRDSNYKWAVGEEKFRYNGLYEGSLFYGTRFEDSTNIEEMIETHRITSDHITAADEYVKHQMSYILHGDLNHYQSLMRLRNRTVAQRLGIKNRPYFISVGH